MKAGAVFDTDFPPYKTPACMHYSESATMCAMRFFASVILMTWPCVIAAAAKKSTYMVQMKFQQKPAMYNTHRDWYTALLHSITRDSDSLLYTYEAAYHGFSATLSPLEAESLGRSDSVLGVHEDTLYALHTTRTPYFMSLKNPHLWEGDGNSLDMLHRASHDVIIGVVDTGVWPESPSFKDDDMPDVPPKWRGKCDTGEAATQFCNKKLIGVRFFNKGHNVVAATDPNESDSSTRDSDGHGTHTSSTAAGAQVSNASLFGYARGKAQGVAYGARLAAYKACWSQGCYGSDLVAAIDRATRDGVDVLSISIGGGPGTPYIADPIAIAAFGASDRGIFVSCSAGNSGPYEGSLANVAPWIMTVGAGTLDRDFPAFVTLGNARNYTGVSLYSGKTMGSKPVEMVYGGGDSSSSFCVEGSLDPLVVGGKVVLCDRGVNARVAKGAVVSGAGGVGMILANTDDNGEELVADSHLLPAVAVGRMYGDLIRKYAKTAKHPTTLLRFGGTVVKVQPSPVVAAFSSRGPNPVTPQIFKPDVIGPGVNILAGWSGAVGPTGLESDTRRTDFNIISGTSMSCPHVSGLAALLKAAHPEWSPSAIKSALITTAYTLDNTKSPLRDAATNNISNPWGHGAGYVNPHKALTPGLVYEDDYIAFLCSIGYTIDMIQSVVRRPNVNCDNKLSDPGQLNYPSLSVVFEKSMVVNYTRELTYVDDAAGSVYQVSVKAPPNVVVTVNPSELVFKDPGEKQRYTVTFVSRKGVASGTSSFGSVIWKSVKKPSFNLMAGVLIRLAIYHRNKICASK